MENEHDLNQQEAPKENDDGWGCLSLILIVILLISTCNTCNTQDRIEKKIDKIIEKQNIRVED